MLAEDTHQIGCLVLGGDDFPDDAEAQLQSWNVSLKIDKVPRRKSMRGKLQYHDDNFHNKTFGYMTPVLQPTPGDLPQPLLHSMAFHFLSSPERLKQHITELLDLREAQGITARPLLIWEPLPTLCRPNELAAHVEASKLVDIFSPNHLELAALCGRLQAEVDQAKPEAGRQHIQSCVAAYLSDEAADADLEQLCIVRAGEHGALVASRSLNAAGAVQIDMTWVDAFYAAADRKRVVDPTGAGNAFLGALAMELLQNDGDAVEAAAKASVASSFVVEQVGLPVLSRDASSGALLWNNASLKERLDEYEQKTCSG
ncbi:hypothetical protein CBER1_01389 [Cercospora berteroae]|uniref:Carbohydrate kinase PfkB domain-containing protein n=1 Tax=Cercospora berteroae TaxID=357750 RepID=A0A2S6CCE8_9PEZI|nr:hypothetical protein CBER1_01389 [Cercospora berteroae]